MKLDKDKTNERTSQVFDMVNSNKGYIADCQDRAYEDRRDFQEGIMLAVIEFHRRKGVEHNPWLYSSEIDWDLLQEIFRE